MQFVILPVCFWSERPRCRILKKVLASEMPHNERTAEWPPGSSAAEPQRETADHNHQLYRLAFFFLQLKTPNNMCNKSRVIAIKRLKMQQIKPNTFATKVQLAKVKDNKCIMKNAIALQQLSL